MEFGYYCLLLFLCFLTYPTCHPYAYLSKNQYSPLSSAIRNNNFNSNPLLSLAAKNSDSDDKFEDDIDAKIDSFLNNEGYIFELPSKINNENIPSPSSDLSPSKTLELALNTLRKHEYGSHIFLTKFCLSLTNSERMNGVKDTFKELIRASITPKMFATKLRSSSFSVLLDWDNISFTEGYSQISSLALINVALFFNDGAPAVIQFMMKKPTNSECWLVDSAVLSKHELFFDDSSDGNVR